MIFNWCWENVSMSWHILVLRVYCIYVFLDFVMFLSFSALPFLLVCLAYMFRSSYYHASLVSRARTPLFRRSVASLVGRSVGRSPPWSVGRSPAVGRLSDPFMYAGVVLDLHIDNHRCTHAHTPDTYRCVC